MRHNGGVSYGDNALQYTSVSNQYVVHFKHTQCGMSVVSQ